MRFCALLLALAAVLAGQTKTYRSRKWGLCASYPATWSRHEGFNRGGARFSPIAEDEEKISITVGALSNQPRGSLTGDLDDNTPMDLAENVRYTLADRVGVEVLTNRPATLQGHPARLLVVREVKNRIPRIEKSIIAVWRGAVYCLELRGEETVVSGFDPVFEAVVASFRFECGGR